MSIQADKIIAVRTSKTIYRDKDTVIKVFDNDYSKADVLNEALNLARVEQTGLPVPKVIEVMKLEGKWAIRISYIAGRTLQQLMNDNPEKQDEYLRFFVDLQIQVHSKEAPFLNNMKEKMNRRICDTELDANTRYELHSRLDSMPRQKELCHGDFKPSNIIITPDDKPYIIDWAHVTSGSASADAVCTYLLLLYKNKELAEDYINMYCEASGSDIEELKKWIPIVAASQSVKAKKEEREFLLSLVNIPG